MRQVESDAKTPEMAPVSKPSGGLLRPAAYFLTGVYLALTLAHQLILGDWYKPYLIAATLITATVALGFALSAAKFSILAQSRCLAVLLFLAAGNSLLHLWFAIDPIQSTNLLVAIIAAGVVFSHRRHWVTCVAGIWLGWIGVILILPKMPLIDHFFFALAMSTLLSWFAHIARQQLVDKQREVEEERDLALLHEAQANAANEAKGEFLTNMSHELRTPMNGVIGVLELLAKSELSHQQQDQLKIAQKSADSLMELINDILDFSKIESGELDLELSDVEVEPFFESLIDSYQTLAQEKGLELYLIVEDIESEAIRTDGVRLTQVLNNLLSNAFKFTETGSVTVRYQLRRGKEDFALRVNVEDTGIGIAPSAQEQLFDSFTQADGSNTREFGGTGLGLAISKHLCELMGGELTVKSQLGQGSTFSFNVKVKPGQVNEFDQSIAIGQTAGHVTESTRALLVEDNEINQQVMLALLETLEINVDVANDGQEALDILAEAGDGRFQVILMDCQMPRLDGYEATRRIRSGEAGKAVQEIPIIALTANAMEGDREKCLASGMNDYLTKPIDVPELEDTLERYGIAPQ